METALLLIGLFLCFFALSAFVYWIARSACCCVSPRLRAIIKTQSLTHTVLVAAAAAIILMVLFFAKYVPIPLRAAKVAKTTNEAYQLQTAILSYYTEYSEWPASSGNAPLVKILTGDNKRHIAFLSLSPSEMNTKGEMVDAWQKPFHISMADPNHPVVSSDMLPFDSESHTNQDDR